MTIEMFMQKNGIKQKKTVEDWLNKGLIPGAVYDEEKQMWSIPQSARRPYTSRAKANADAKTIRASIVNAAIKRQHITADTYHMSQNEFEMLIEELASLGFIRTRVEDGITYYDSTCKSDEWNGKSIKELEKVICSVISAVAEGTSKGVTSAMLSC